MMEVMEPLTFAKGQATGNDFVIVPDPDGQLILNPELVAGLCDRRFGIGGDGLLRVVRTAADPELAAFVGGSGAAEWFMDYRNADGSLAEMCGNGVRVFARYLVETELVAVGEFVIGTRSGPVPVVVSPDAVSLTLGPTRVLGASSARLTGDGRLGGLELPGLAVDCGNPHLVCPLPAGIELVDADLSRPPEVDRELFPAGANVELIAPLPGEAELGADHIRMRVHERGVGETLSCGSGACAAAAAVRHVAGHRSGVVTVDVSGGRLLVALTPEDCVLTGPAVIVAHGTTVAGLATS